MYLKIFCYIKHMIYISYLRLYRLLECFFLLESSGPSLDNFVKLLLQVVKPLNQVLSSLVDQEAGHQIEHDNFSSDGTYAVEEFEVRILEPEKSGGPWQIRGTIPMQSSENALTVRVVTLFVSLKVILTFSLF